MLDYLARLQQQAGVREPSKSGCASVLLLSSLTLAASACAVLR
jgi:hypothetical protein